MSKNTTIILISSAIMVVFILLVLLSSLLSMQQIELNRRLHEQSFINSTLPEYTIINRQELKNYNVQRLYLLEKNGQRYYGFILRPASHLDGLLAIYSREGLLIELRYLIATERYIDEQIIVSSYENLSLQIPVVLNSLSRLSMGAIYQSLDDARQLVLKGNL